MKYQKKNKIKEQDSINLLLNLLEGTVEVLKKYPKDFELFIKKVTSKGGTTEEAMRVFKEKKIVFNKFDSALRKATKKSVLLSKKY